MGTIFTTTKDKDINASTIGAIAAQPTSGSYSVVTKRLGNFWSLKFAFTACRIPVTDAAGSGSSGSIKIFDFVEGGIHLVSSRHDWNAFAEGSALTGGANDAAFVIAFGSVAADAGDGALTGTEVNFGATKSITLPSTGLNATTLTGAQTPLDGTATAVDLYLNWSGTAATIDANSYIDVTGTAEFVGTFIGDD